jgi:hypothetical protein
MSSANNNSGNNTTTTSNYHRRKNDDPPYSYTSYQLPPSTHGSNSNMSTVPAANKRRRVEVKRDLPALGGNGGNGVGIGGIQGQEEYVSAVVSS